ncbi:MAG TPA: pentapeptide repeat-containing protein [Pilimelia sp.]|nr:pentapeptide repeat-containing protein [Pilimelia sp.]
MTEPSPAPGTPGPNPVETRLRLVPIRRALGWTIAAAVLLLVAFVAAGFLALGSPGVERKNELAVADLFELLKLAFAVAAGLGAVVALVMAYRRQRVAEAANELAEAANRLAEATQEHRQRVDEATQRHQEGVAADARHDAAERRITELYMKAADQLGSDKAPVRLAGLYALERLAQGNAEHRQTVVDVLCAYLRMPLTGADPDAGGDPDREEGVVRGTAQRVLATHLRPASGDRFWPGIELDLTGAGLVELDFRGISARRADFTGASFYGLCRFTEAAFERQARFSGARFLGPVDLAGASFGGSASFAQAEFHGEVTASGTSFNGRCSLVEARFRGDTGLSDATFRGETVADRAVFEGTTLFSRATFARTSFNLVRFEGEVSFTGARFTDILFFAGSAFQTVSFNDADFRGHAGFRRVTFAGEATFIGATFHEGVNFRRTVLSPAATLDGATVYGLDQHYERTWPDGWRIHPEDVGRGVVVRSAPPEPTG